MFFHGIFSWFQNREWRPRKNKVIFFSAAAWCHPTTCLNNNWLSQMKSHAHSLRSPSQPNQLFANINYILVIIVMFGLFDGVLNVSSTVYLHNFINSYTTTTEANKYNQVKFKDHEAGMKVQIGSGFKPKDTCWATHYSFSLLVTEVLSVVWDSELCPYTLIALKVDFLASGIFKFLVYV